MFVIIVSGFEEKGKSRLISDIIDRTYDSKDEVHIDILLFELLENDLRLPSNQDGMVIREMGGGCPCCTLEGELRKVLKAEDRPDGRMLVIEAGGGCDIQRMRTILREESPSHDVASVVVMDSSTMKVVLEVVPVMGENIASSDLLIVMETDDAWEKDFPADTVGVGPVRALIRRGLVRWDGDVGMVPLSPNGQRMIDVFFDGMAQS